MTTRVQSIIIRDNRALFAYGNGGNGNYRHSFVGGRLEPGESAEEGILREVAEEACVDGAIVFRIRDEATVDHITFLVDIGNQVPTIGFNPEEVDLPFAERHLQRLVWLDLSAPDSFTAIDKHFFRMLLQECETRSYQPEWKGALLDLVR